MSISGVASTGGFDASKMASYIMKKSDANSDGSLDKSEFTKSLVDKGVSEEDAAAKFDSIDKNKTGKISQSDLEAEIKTSAKQGPPPGAEGAGKTGGSPPSSGSQASASTTKTYDAADTNEDGTVSATEQLIYDIKSMAPAANDESETDDANESSQTSVQVVGNTKIGSNIDVTA